MADDFHNGGKLETTLGNCDVCAEPKFNIMMRLPCGDLICEGCGAKWGDEMYREAGWDQMPEPAHA